MASNTGLASANVSAGDDATATQYNNLVTDIKKLRQESMTAGATINGSTLPVPVYQNTTDNEVYACDANVSTKLNFVGFAITNSTDGNAIIIQHTGIVGGFSGLDEGEKYYVQNTVGTIGKLRGDDEILVGIAISATKLLILKEEQGIEMFGDGSDGDVTISSNITLTRDMYYRNLTIDNGYTLNTGGYLVFVKSTLTVNGTIGRNGNNGGAGGTGNKGGWSSGAAVGAAGAAGAALADGSLKGTPAGGAGALGKGGGVWTTISATGNNGVAGNNETKGTVDTNGKAGSAGGNVIAIAGNGTGGTGASGGVTTQSKRSIRNIVDATIMEEAGTKIGSAASSGGGGSGAGGGGGSQTTSGYGGSSGGGGGGATSGGSATIFAKEIIVSASGIISCKGGAGGAGGAGGDSYWITNETGDYSAGAGGSGGGGGGNGGNLVIVYKALSNSGSISVAGGAGGVGGAGGNGYDVNHGSSGTAGITGSTGVLVQLGT